MGDCERAEMKLILMLLAGLLARFKVQGQSGLCKLVTSIYPEDAVESLTSYQSDFTGSCV